MIRRNAILAVFALLLTTAVGFEKEDNSTGTAITRQHPDIEGLPKPGNQDIELYRAELLDLAFATASTIHIKPHIKNRSRAQESVVGACLELDQPALALSYIPYIENWRRGLSYARLSLYLAEHDFEQVEPFLERAADDLDSAKDWRRERLSIHIAQAWLRLGNEAISARYARGVGRAEIGKVSEVRATMADEESFGEQLERMKAIVAIDNLNMDVNRNILGAYAALYERFYEDEERRGQVEDAIRETWTKVPVIINIEVLMRLSRTALDNGDSETAQRLLNECMKYLDYPWGKPEDKIRFAAELAGKRHEAGLREEAKKQADEFLEYYEEKRPGIVDIFRCRALRPLAEAYVAMGDMETAARVYTMAVEEGFANPNLRPRGEDLTATLCSMALHSFEPDDALWRRIHQVHSELKTQ